MRVKMEWGWERLDHKTYRAKVIGGWLLLHCASSLPEELLHFSGVDAKKMFISESMIFIPDRDHEWTIVVHNGNDSNKKGVNPNEFG